MKKKVLAILYATVMMFGASGALPNLSTGFNSLISASADTLNYENYDERSDYLEDMPIIDSDRYTGNEGDSFIYKIGEHKYSRGNKDIDGFSYTHGLEAWIARWNYTAESSWAYSIFDLGGKYSSLSGKCVLIKSYNTTNFDTTLKFIGDGKLIKSYHLTPESIPFDINIDVSGVKMLKVYAYDNKAVFGGTSFGLTGMVLKSDLNKPISNCTITLSSTSYTYDGSAKKPSITVNNGSNTLTNGTDYTVSYSNNINAGTGKVTVTGAGKYTGAVTKTFIINAKNMKTDSLSCSISPALNTYDGIAKTPKIIVNDSVTSKALIEGVDYSVQFSNNIKTGTAIVSLTGTGNYRDTRILNFYIDARDISDTTITLNQTSYTYDDAEKEPTVIVKDGSTTLTYGTDYTVSYSNNKNVGTAKVTVTGMGNYTGSVSKNFTIEKEELSETKQIADVNGDGTIDIEDAVMIINHINGVKALTGKQFNCADVDGNGSIDIEDAVRIVNHINGVKAIGKDNTNKSVAEQYYNDNAEIIDVTDITPKEALSEEEVTKLLNQKGFKDYPITYNYSMSGDFDSEQESNPSSNVKHPMYGTYYVSKNNEVWYVTVVGKNVYANPLSFNIQTDRKVPTILSTSNTIIGYDDEKDKLYTVIPKESAMMVVKVDDISSDLLDNLTVEEVEKL